jgi:endonuclease/exonuclease/phosphatase family metal-dependent hydrolase
VSTLSEIRRPAPRLQQRPRYRRPWYRTIELLELLTWLSLAGVLTVWVLLGIVSERWWLGTILMYLPRSPYLLPAVGLGVWAVLRKHRRALCVNVVAALLVLGPLMDLQGNPAKVFQTTRRTGPDLCIATCNVHNYRPYFGRLLDEVSHVNPDIVAFQEAFTDTPKLASYFHGWNVEHVDEYFVASRYPVKLLETYFSTAYDRIGGGRFEVETPQGKILVYNIHPTSPRKGLVEVRPWSPITNTGVGRVERHATLRGEEIHAMREFIHAGDPELPFVVVGDFNMPCDSNLYQAAWSGLADAFKQGGFGYGYTILCYTGTIWPNHCPWLQVDHILTSSHWETLRCWVGSSDGSDHRMMIARLRRHSAP